MQEPSRRASLRRLGTLAVFLTAARYGSAQAQTPTLRVGVRGGTDEEIWEVVTQVAKKNGLNVKPVVVTGAASPNEALNNGDLEANSFQHVPFLRDQVQQRGYKLVSVGDTYISPIAFYSKKHKRFGDLPENARLGIPNDPSNQTRALVVLRDQGVLTLREGFDPAKGTATLADITGYRKKVQLVEAASVVLARSLEDLDASAIVNTFAYQAGLIATRDGLAVEKRENNPYVNIIVVREQDRGAAWVAPLVRSYQSPEVRAFIERKYQGSVVPAF
ncbi:MAG: metal ABC transporter substrate-binding protein [Variovorax paradoxus]|jgi:D-methionine transport system substrate-binding protein|nr:MAG: metal ABC transporter substrate-binding protein [Variovorax paradoxus]PZQ05969.1 MAG: metal ABC transporter substrate-binding protein [Variovorax paradoxus]